MPGGHVSDHIPSQVAIQSLSRVWLFATPWTGAHQAPQSMGFPRQEYWSGYSFPPPGDLLDPEIEPESPALAGGLFITEPPGKPFPSHKHVLKPRANCKCECINSPFSRPKLLSDYLNMWFARSLTWSKAKTENSKNRLLHLLHGILKKYCRLTSRLSSCSLHYSSLGKTCK